jgi:cell division septation protein DedD/nucleoid DNA-binding protein
MDIRNCIAELLSVHDCVIIPGFGGFIGNYSPARIDPVHHSFQPPAKKLLFNINLKQNDGLLANAVADSFGTSYLDACKLIDDFSEECRHALKSGKSFVIHGVGRLFSGREGNIQFEQDNQSNLLPDAFGLTSFISPPISRNSSVIIRDKSFVSTGVSTVGKKLSLPRSLKWAAILALPIGVATLIGVTQYDKNSSDSASNAGILSSVFSRFSSASLVEKKDAPQTQPESHYQVDPAPSAFEQQTSSDDPANADQTLVQNQPTEQISQDPSYTESNNSTLSEPEPVVERRSRSVSSEDSFVIIVGAFRSKQNAEKYVAELKEKGTEASVFDRSKSGLYRVAIGTFSQREEALQLLSSAKSSDFAGAWLLVK